MNCEPQHVIVRNYNAPQLIFDIHPLQNPVSAPPPSLSLSLSLSLCVCPSGVTEYFGGAKGGGGGGRPSSGGGDKRTAQSKVKWGGGQWGPMK